MKFIINEKNCQKEKGSEWFLEFFLSFESIYKKHWLTKDMEKLKKQENDLKWLQIRIIPMWLIIKSSKKL